MEPCWPHSIIAGAELDGIMAADRAPGKARSSRISRRLRGKRTIASLIGCEPSRPLSRDARRLAPRHAVSALRPRSCFAQPARGCEGIPGLRAPRGRRGRGDSLRAPPPVGAAIRVPGTLVAAQAHGGRAARGHLGQPQEWRSLIPPFPPRRVCRRGGILLCTTPESLGCVTVRWLHGIGNDVRHHVMIYDMSNAPYLPSTNHSVNVRHAMRHLDK